MELKTCGKCEEIKPLEEFHRNRARRDGRINICKTCCTKKQVEYYQRNKEKIRKKNAEYWKRPKSEEQRKKTREQKAAYREKNKEELYKRQREYYKNNKEKVLKRGRERYREDMANPEKKELILARQNKYTINKRRNDPVFKVSCNMRQGMWKCLKGLYKTSRTFSYIDKSPEELMNYLEKQFTEGMSRENYGEWHVDHIRPLASFEFDKYKEGSAEFEALLGEAWHYTNLQPLWAADNVSKGARWGPVEKD
jgi:hypothetical protein